MAESDPVKSDQVIDPALFTEQIKQTRELRDAVDDLVSSFKLLVAQTGGQIKLFDLNTLEGQEKLIKANEKLKTTEDALTLALRKREDLSKKLNNLESVQAVEVAKLNEKIRERTRLNKELARDELGLTSAYQKSRKELNEMRNAYRELALAGRENGIVGRGLKQSIDEQASSLNNLDDSLGVHQQHVGKYGANLGALSKGLKGVSVLSALLAKAFGVNTEVIDSAVIALSRFSKGVKGFDNSKKLVKGFGDETKIVGENMGNVATQTTKASGATKEMTVLQRIFNNVVKANPILFIIGALVLVIGLLIKYKDALFGISSQYQKNIDKQQKLVDLEEKKLKDLEGSVNQLKLAGKSEREILDLKIKQLDVVIQTRMELLHMTIEQSLAAERIAQRNKDILQGILKIVLFPMTALLAQIDLVGKAFGKNFDLVNKFTGGIAELVFDPDEMREKGKKTRDEMVDTLKELMEKRAGFLLDVKEMDQKAYDDEIARQKKLQDDLEKLRKQGYDDALKARKDFFEKSKKIVEDRIKLEKDAEKDRRDLNKQQDDRDQRIREEERQQNQEDSIKRDEMRQKRIAQFIEDEQLFQNAIADGLNQRREQKMKALDDELAMIDENIKVQRDLQLNGDANTLAFAEKQRADALAKRAELEKKQKRQEELEDLAELFLKFAQGYAENGDLDANAKAFAQTLIAKGLTRAIAGTAEEGVEDTGRLGHGGMDGRGGRLWMLHDNEGVVTKKANEDAPGLVGLMNRKGFEGAREWAMQNIFPDYSRSREGYHSSDNTALIAEVMHDGLNKISKEVKNAGTHLSLDDLNNWVETKYHNGNRQTTVKKRQF